MKKIIAMLLVLALSASLVACSSSTKESSSSTSSASSTVSSEAESSEESEEAESSAASSEASSESSEESSEAESSEESAVVGGYTVNSETALPEDAKAALEKATEAYTGMTFVPVALLGTQVVSGTNYKIFCAGTTVTATPEQSWVIVTVYQDLEGNCEISNVETYMANDSELTGAYTVNENASSAPLSDEEKTRFEKAVEGLTGASYEPVAMLGTQVVSGTNYKYLCLETTVTAEPSYKWSVVTVYEDLDGNITLGEVENLEI